VVKAAYLALIRYDHATTFIMEGDVYGGKYQGKDQNQMDREDISVSQISSVLGFASAQWAGRINSERLILIHIDHLELEQGLSNCLLYCGWMNSA